MVTFESICNVYTIGSGFGLLKSDIDTNSKSKQASVERMISDSCIDGLDTLYWTKGTQFLVFIAKKGDCHTSRN